MRATGFARLWRWTGIGIVVASVGWVAQAKEPSPVKQPTVKPQPIVAAVVEPAPSGHELFTREWLPNDARAHGGDGLGPVYNDSSCVACHNQGGTGGSGPASKNVDILTAFRESTVVQEIPRPVLAAAVFDSLFGTVAPGPARRTRTPSSRLSSGNSRGSKNGKS